VQPPASLALPERGATLDGVTVIEPGLSRSEGRRVVIRGDRIEAVDVNPLVALPDRAVVVDALIVPKAASRLAP